MSDLGPLFIDDVLTFYANTHRFDTGVATDADAVPAWRCYEETTTTPILTGTMALLDSVNTAGFYSTQITLSAANGFEVGKSYAIYISAAVNSVTGTMHHSFRVGPVQANTVQLSGDATAADNAEAFFDGTGYSGTGNTIPTVTAVTTVNGLAANSVTAAALATDAVTEIQAGLSTLTAGQVNAEVVDALSTDVTGEPAQGAPPVSASIVTKLAWLYKAFRNKNTATSTLYSLYNDAGTVVDAKATLSDAAGTTTKEEIVAGP